MEAGDLNTENVSSASGSDVGIFDVSRPGIDMCMEMVESRLRRKFQEQTLLIESLKTERDRLTKNSETKAFKIQSLQSEFRERQQIHEKEIESLKEYHKRNALDNIAADELIQRAVFALQDYWVHRTSDAEATTSLISRLRQQAKELTPTKYGLLSMLEEIVLMADECHIIKDKQLSNKDLLIYQLQSQIAAQYEFQHYLYPVKGDDEYLECANSGANTLLAELNNASGQATAQDGMKNLKSSGNESEAFTQESYITDLQQQIVCYRQLLEYKTLKCDLITKQFKTHVERSSVKTTKCHVQTSNEDSKWRVSQEDLISLANHGIVSHNRKRNRRSSDSDIDEYPYVLSLKHQLADKTSECELLTRAVEIYENDFFTLCEQRDEAQDWLLKLYEYEGQIEQLTMKCSEHEAKVENQNQRISQNCQFNESQHEELLRCRADYQDLRQEYDSLVKFMAELEENLFEVTQEFVEENPEPIHPCEPQIASHKGQEDLLKKSSEKDKSDNADVKLTSTLRDLIESKLPTELQTAYDELFSQDEVPSFDDLERREKRHNIKTLEAEIEDLRTQLADARSSNIEEQKKRRVQVGEARRVNANLTNTISQLKEAFQTLYTTNPETFRQTSSSTLARLLKMLNVDLIFETKVKQTGSCLDFSMLRTPCRGIDEENSDEMERNLLDLLIYFQQLQDILGGIFVCIKAVVPFDDTYILEPLYNFVQSSIEPMLSLFKHDILHYRGRINKLASTLEIKLETPWQMTLGTLNMVLRDINQVLPQAYAINSEIECHNYKGFCDELESAQDPLLLLEDLNSLTAAHIMQVHTDLNIAQLAKMNDIQRLKLLQEALNAHKTLIATMLIQLNHAPTTVLSVLKEEKSFLTSTPKDILSLIIQGFNKSVTREVFIARIRTKLEDLLIKFKRFSVVVTAYAEELVRWANGRQTQPEMPDLSTILEENTQLDHNHDQSADDEETSEQDEKDNTNDIEDPIPNHGLQVRDPNIQTDRPQMQIEVAEGEQDEESIGASLVDQAIDDQNDPSDDIDSKENALRRGKEGYPAFSTHDLADENYRRGVWD